MGISIFIDFCIKLCYNIYRKLRETNFILKERIELYGRESFGPCRGY